MIRFANKFDIDDIIKLLKEFAESSPLAMKFDPMNWSRTEIVATLTSILSGQGFILIDNKKTSILIAVKSNPMWVNNAIQLQECMLYSPNKITQSKLIMKFVSIAKEMLEKKEIHHAVMYSYVDSNFEKLGLKKTQYIWEV